MEIKTILSKLDLWVKLHPDFYKISNDDEMTCESLCKYYKKCHRGAPRHDNGEPKDRYKFPAKYLKKYPWGSYINCIRWMSDDGKIKIGKKIL